MPEFAPGDVFVGHRIEGLAGRGGMGVVYRATQLDLARTVALKVITPALADEPDFRARFVAESRAAASIEHPNVLPVYSAGDHDGVLYIVMRYVDGPDMRALVRASGGLDPDRAAGIVAQVGAALDAAHRHGLVHRDVKPANVLIDAQEHAYLTDFGLTKRLASTVDPSRSGSWVGTLGYVAPEQIRGERVDARTDVYALGCVLVHALAGRAPYMRETDEATMWAHLNAPPPSEAVPPEFEGVVARALAKDPSDRYQSTGDLGRAALAAAGRSDVRAPERLVARGAAAPLDATAPTRSPGGGAFAAADAQTHASPPVGTARADGAGGARADAQSTPVARPARRTARSGRRRRLALGGALAAVTALAVLAVVLLGGDSDGDPASPTATATAPAPSRPRIDAAVPLVARPNSLAFSAGTLAVLSARSGELAFVDARTGAAGARIDVGGGASGVAAGFGSLWVTKFRTRSLLRIDPRTQRRAGAAIALPAGAPVAVATGEQAVWVGTHGAAGASDSVVKVVPRSDKATQVIPIDGGIQDLAVGDGAVWVSNRSRAAVVRISTRDGSRRQIRVGAQPRGLAVGDGAVWVAGAGDDSVTRIDATTLGTRSIQLDVTPERVAVGGGSVWVTARAAATLIQIDARHRRVSATIRTGRGPFAVGVYRDQSVWLTLVGENAIQRVRLP